jgi:hypothetical protein
VVVALTADGAVREIDLPGVTNYLPASSLRKKSITTNVGCYGMSISTA